MTDEVLKRIAFDIARARILFERGDIEGGQMLLDDASELIPDEFWPAEKELEDVNAF